MSAFSFTVEIAGITIRIDSPRNMEIPPELRPFLTDRSDAQEVYEMELIHEPMVFHRPPVYTATGLAVYPYEDGSYRELRHLQAADGCTAVCCLRHSGHHSLYIPAKDWERYERNCTLSVLLAPEALFLRHSAFLLHSSVVHYQGQGILFFGASGAGKSTQAALWEQYRGAEILNGDRCVIRKLGDEFCGSGSPYCGSSGIYRRESVPISALILPVHGADNRIELMTPEAALHRIYRECLVNLWDTEFMNKLFDLLQALVLRVPVFTLHGRPDAQATEITRQAIFGGD